MLVMTSASTHRQTLEYFAANDNMGFAGDDLTVFCQGSMPAVDRRSGQLLMKSKHELSLSPDGHGGMLPAMAQHGLLSRLGQAGIKYLFYGQVDNPLLQVCDPLTIGAHILSESEMTTQVIRKTDPLQKVGNVVSVDGKLRIIEYSDLPEAIARQVNSDGSPRLWAGSIAVHVFDVAFLARCIDQASALPFHLAHKRVAHIDARGNVVHPSEPNAVKFERFIFDLLPLANKAIVLEIDPAEGFSPVKNGAGAAVDTAATARAAMVRRQKHWLRQCGISVGDDVEIEICPKFAIDDHELRGKVAHLSTIDRPLFLRH